ncbi:MAG: PKD domain-containing protein [Chloroflexota bacterium]
MSARLSSALMALLFAVVTMQLSVDTAAARPVTEQRGALSAPARTNAGELFAATLRLPASVAAIDGRISYASTRAELIGLAPAGAGRAFRPITSDNGAAFGAYGLTATGGVSAIDLVIEPRSEGRLQLRVVIDTAVDAVGAAVALPQTEFVTTVTVGADNGLLVAPKFKDRQRPNRGPAKVRELQRDGRFDKVDLDAARVAWDQTRELATTSGDVCGVAATSDPNGDGCSDIADVQTMLSVQGARTGAVAAAAAFVFTVNSNADTADAALGNGICADSAGRCTLRAAMAEANWHAGDDRIEFAIAGTAPILIQAASQLPNISQRTGTLTIDAYTQPGARVNTSTTSSNAIPGIELRGPGSSTRALGFYITSANNMIRGIAMNNWYNAVFIDGPDAGGNRIVGNWLGFRGDSTTLGGAHFNVVLNTGAHDNIIGTADAADRNVSGGATHAIELYGPGTARNIIQNNLLCIRPNGTSTASCSTGIDHNFGPQDGLIGGSAPNERNVIGPTSLQGIELSHGWDPAIGSANGSTPTYQINGHRVLGNWVGFPGDGHYLSSFRSATSSPGGGDNGQGINVYDGSNNNLVEGNYVASNYDGIQFASGNALANTARGNFIGLSPFGEAAPLSRWGIKIRLGTRLHNLENNTIANATLGGINVINNSTGIKMSQNIITTSGWAIDLYGVAGPDANDVGDGDLGANTLLNTPEITGATSTLVSGTGLPGAVVEVFRATRAAGQFGMPDRFLGSATVAAGGAWNVPVTTLVGDRVTATQIRNGRDTSELSANALVAVGTPNNAPTANFTFNCTQLFCSFTDTSSDSDGTIASRSWDFGDGGTSTNTNPGHTYAANGTYSVTLTVTDDGGQVDTETKSVTAAKANVAPVADFTVACTELACDFTDTSSDSDGTIAGRSWTFGDGDSSTATNPSHAYAASNTYSVTLTVTDNGGLTGATTQSVTVAQANVLARDTFSRTSSSGWGSADVGGNWTVTGTTANYAVSGGLGRITIPAKGATRSAALTGVSATNVDLLVLVSSDTAGSGGGLFLYTEGRYVDNGTQYRGKVRISSAGSVFVGASRLVGGTQAAVGAEVQVAGLTYTAGTQLWVRSQFTGTSPTTIRVKVWTGATEPAAWTYTGTDSTAALQVAGGIGLRTYLAADAATIPVNITWDELTVKQLP